MKKYYVNDSLIIKGFIRFDGSVTDDENAWERKDGSLFYASHLEDKISRGRLVDGEIYLVYDDGSKRDGMNSLFYYGLGSSTNVFLTDVLYERMKLSLSEALIEMSREIEEED